MISSMLCLLLLTILFQYRADFCDVVLAPLFHTFCSITRKFRLVLALDVGFQFSVDLDEQKKIKALVGEIEASTTVIWYIIWGSFGLVRETEAITTFSVQCRVSYALYLWNNT